MRYCHATHNPSCPICQRYATDPAFRAAIDKVPSIGKGKAGSGYEQKARRTLKCLYLGPMIDRVSNCNGKCPHGCEKGHGPTRPGIECQTCDDYESDAPEPEPGFFDRIASEQAETLPDVSPVENKRPVYNGSRLAFSHHGDVGDIIYALQTVKQFCDNTQSQSEFYCYPRVGTRVTMTREHANNLLPLLRVQTYISAAEWSPEFIGVKLDAARRFAFKDPGAGLNIAEQYRQWAAMPRVDRTKPWLRVDRIERVAPVIFNRTPRYRPPAFPWKRIAETIGKHAVFIGSPAEYEAFKEEVSPDVPYYPTKTLIDAARVIAGCDLFVGNQSSPRAIAEGLKVNVIVEESKTIGDTKFLRKGAWYGKTDKFWPDILDRIGDLKNTYRDYDAGDKQVGMPTIAELVLHPMAGGPGN
jgi:hypothetical protein